MTKILDGAKKVFPKTIFESARLIVILWAIFWTLFGLISGLIESMGFIGVILSALIPGAIFFASAFLAIKWDIIGGPLLIIEGVIIGVAFPINARETSSIPAIIFTVLTMAIPPLAAGTLFILHFKKSREKDTSGR